MKTQKGTTEGSGRDTEILRFLARVVLECFFCDIYLDMKPQ